MRLTEEQASYYLPWEGKWKEQFKLKDCYYSISKPNDEGFEDITYYIPIQRNVEEYDGEGPYYVYVLSNQAYGKDVYKIGYTKKHPQARAEQLSRASGVVWPFEVKYVFKCHDGGFLEREVHLALNLKRLNKHREFFQCDLEEIKQTIKKLGIKYK